MLFIQALLIYFIRANPVADTTNIKLIYPDDQAINVSFDFTVDAQICNGLPSKTWNLYKNSDPILKEDVSIQVDKIHILYNESFMIKDFQDIGLSYYFPMVCFVRYLEHMIKYTVLYRPNFTIAIDTKDYIKKDKLSINGNVTDWDSTNLTFQVMLNDIEITTFNLDKSKSTEALPFTTSISLRTAKLGQNDITIIVTDNDGLSLNQTHKIFVRGIEPIFSLQSDDSTTYKDNENINVKLSISKVDVADYLDVYYSIDETNKWTLAKQIDLNNDIELPLDVEFSVSSNLPEGDHSISVKCTDSNGMTSLKNPAKTFSIIKESASIMSSNAPNPPNVIQSPTQTAIAKATVSNKTKQAAATLLASLFAGLIFLYTVIFFGFSQYKQRCYHSASSASPPCL